MDKKLQLYINFNARTGELTTAHKELNRFNSTINKTTQQTNRLDSSVDRLTSRLTTMGAAVAGAFVFDKIAQGTSNVISTFADLEDAAIGVQKTTGLSGKALDELTDKLDAMSTANEGFEVENLYTISAAAGQLGIAGVNNLTKFTEAIAKVEITSEMSAQEASKTFAKLTNILHEPIEQIETLASVFNELSNTTTANVQDLSMFTMRLGGAGKIIGLTSAEILALGATLNDTGNNFEIGGSAISRLMMKMSADTKDYAEAMGVDFEQFAHILHTKPIRALELFFKHIQALDASKQIEFLRKLQLDGVESASVLLKMSTATDKLSQNLTTANNETIRGTSINIEYAAAAESLRMQQTKTNSELKLFAQALGSELKPALLEGSALLGEFAHWGTQNADTIIGVTKVTGELILAYGSYKAAVLVATAVTKAYTAATATSAVVVGKYGQSIKSATLLQRAFNIAIKANPLGLIATGAVLAYEGVTLLNSSLEETRKKADELDGLNARALELATEYYDLQDKIENGSWLFKQGRVNELKDVEKEIGVINSRLNNMFTENIKKVEKNTKDTAKTIKTSLADITKPIKYEVIEDPKQASLIKKIADEHKAQQESIKSQWQKYYEEIGELDTAWGYERENILKEFSYLSQTEQEKIIALRKKEYFEISKVAKDEAGDVVSIWSNVTESMADSFDNNLFDALTGKFTDFKSFLKTTFSDLGNYILSPFAKQLSSSFLGRSALSTLSVTALKANGGRVDEATGNIIGSGVTEGIIADSGGQILSGSAIAGNSNLSDALSYTSNLKSAYSLATNGISGSIISSSQSIASGINSLGFTGVANGVGGFGYGLSSPLTALGNPTMYMQAGQMVGGALIGYAVGSIGDALFNADTHAANAGAVGAAIGTYILPGIGTFIGALLGSAIGGLFGKTKQVGSGFNLQSSAGFGDVADIQGYSSFEKNSWFNDKSWTNVHELSSSDKAQINSIFGTFEFLLDSLTDNKDVIVQAGMYSGTQLIDTALPKAFLQAMTGLSNIPATIGDSALDKVFDSWNEYAISFDKTVTEALTESVGSFITAQSSWKRTIAQIDGEDILSFDIDVAKKGLKNQIAIYGSSLRDVEGLQSALDNLDFKAFTELSSELIDHNYFKPENLEIVTALGNELGKLASLEAKRVEQLKAEEETLKTNEKAYVTAVNKNFNSLLDPDTLYIDGNKWVEIGEAASWAFKVGEDGIRNTAKTIEETLINNPKLDESGDILNSTTTFLNAAITSLNNFKNALGTLSSSVQSSIDSLTSRTFKYSDIKNISGNLAHSTNETFLADATGMQNDILNWYQGTTELKGIYDGLSVNNKTYTKKDLDNQLAVVKSGKDIKKEINTFNSMLSSYKSTLDEQTNIVANIESVTNSLHDSVISMSLDDSISYLSHQDRAGIALSEYKTAFTGLKGAMSSGNSSDTSLYLSRVVENSKAYLTNLKEYSGASNYQFEFARIATQLKGVGGLTKAQKTQEELTAETNRYMSDIQAAILSYDPTIAKSTEELAGIAKDELLGLQNLINQKSFDPTINVSPVIYVNGVQTEAIVQSNNVAISPTTSSPYAGASYSDLIAGKTSDDLTPTFASQLRVAALAENNTAGYAIVDDWLKNEGFRTAGYTGDGDPYSIAGSVHKKEYVIGADQVSNPINRDILARLEAQRKGQKGNSLNLGSSQKAQGLEEQNELLKEQNSMLIEQNEMMYEALKTNKEMLDIFEKWDLRGLITKAVS